MFLGMCVFFVFFLLEALWMGFNFVVKFTPNIGEEAVCRHLGPPDFNVYVQWLRGAPC